IGGAHLVGGALPRVVVRLLKRLALAYVALRRKAQRLAHRLAATMCTTRVPLSREITSGVHGAQILTAIRLDDDRAASRRRRLAFPPEELFTVTAKRYFNEMHCAGLRRVWAGPRACPRQVRRTRVHSAHCPILRYFCLRRLTNRSGRSLRSSSRLVLSTSASERAAASWLACAPPSGSGTISSITRISSRSGDVMRSAFAARSRISGDLPSFQRIAAHPSTVMTE